MGWEGKRREGRGKRIRRRMSLWLPGTEKIAR